MSKIELIATATFGLEALVAREVKDLGYEEVTVENGRVTFTADELAICRTNLWLRTADRVLLKMGSFKATTFEELFQQTKKLPWPDILPENASFPVEGKSINSKLFSVPDCQAIVKKAVVEKMKQKYHREWFAEDGPRYKIEVALLKDEVTLTIDTSGPGLHKRGYRKLASDAPLKETLAAAMIILAHWFPDRVLMDPVCGSGTIPIEAALIGLNIAPGIKRSFAAETWPTVPKALWQEAWEEALAVTEDDRELRIIGTDIDEKVLAWPAIMPSWPEWKNRSIFSASRCLRSRRSRNTGISSATHRMGSGQGRLNRPKNSTAKWAGFLPRLTPGRILLLLPIRGLRRFLAARPGSGGSFTTAGLSASIINTWAQDRCAMGWSARRPPHLLLEL